MDIFQELGIEKYINAHDTITLYGGSRISKRQYKAMEQISSVFVDMRALQRNLGAKIATMTHNESAYITSGAAAAIQLAAAVCMAEGSEYVYKYLPEKVKSSTKQDFIVFHGQHIVYDQAIKGAGGRIKLVGDSDGVLEFDLEGAIDDQTAGIFYFPILKFERASLSLERTIEIAHANNIPVIVDAAAQLPPVDNFWKFTALGADMVIFSGGKTLSGPQDSGLIVGKNKYIEWCNRFGAPEHGVCRVSKCSREAMIGLYVAISDYLALDQEKEWKRMSDMVDKIIYSLSEFDSIQAYRCEHGSVGQSYPRVFIKVPCTRSFIDAMRERHIFIGLNNSGEVYISVQNINSQECNEVISALKEICKEY